MILTNNRELRPSWQPYPWAYMSPKRWRNGFQFHDRDASRTKHIHPCKRHSIGTWEEGHRHCVTRFQHLLTCPHFPNLSVRHDAQMEGLQKKGNQCGEGAAGDNIYIVGCRNIFMGWGAAAAGDKIWWGRWNILMVYIN